MAIPESTNSQIFRTIDMQVLIAWNGVNYVDETTYVISVDGALELVPSQDVLQGGNQVIQQCTIQLSNTDFRFSPWNTDGPYFAYIAKPAYYRKPVRVSVRENNAPAWTRIFTGFAKFPEESYSQGTISLTVSDLGEMMRKKRTTTAVTGYFEHELVIKYLHDVGGLIDGVDYISPAWADSHQVTATIDRSNIVVDMSWLDDESIWDELVDVGQASGSRIYVDKNGMVRFEKGWGWFVDRGVVETLGIGHVSEIAPQYKDTDFFEEIVVEYSPRWVGGEAIIYSLEKAFIIHPGETEDLIMRFQWPVMSQPVFTKGTTYRFLVADGTDVSAQIPSQNVVEVWGAQQLKITVTNNSNDLIYIPTFDLKAMPILGGPSNQVERVITASETGKRLEIRGNPYIQTKEQAQAVCDFLAWWYVTPKLTVVLSKIRGVASRDLGQRVTVVDNVDPTYAYIDFTGIVTKIDFSLRVNSDTGTLRFEQDLTLLEDIFMDDDMNWFVIHVHSWGDATTMLWH